MVVRVSRALIRVGVPSCHDLCPVALAVHEADPSATRVEVGKTAIDVWWGSLVARMASPEPVQRFVNGFDNTGTGEPFEFELDEPFAPRASK